MFLHELQYPLLQGWDSVVVRADVELGATDQLFNIMVGRDLQKEEGQPQQIACLQPVLEGLDGIQKMSKSLNNYVGICEAPTEMFGKLMSISDVLMGRYYEFFWANRCRRSIRWRPRNSSLQESSNSFTIGLQPRLLLKSSICASPNGIWIQWNLPTVSAAELGSDLVSAIVTAYAKGFGMVRSRSDARRLAEQGSVQWRGEKITDPKAQLNFTPGEILRLDKTRAVR